MSNDQARHDPPQPEETALTSPPAENAGAAAEVAQEAEIARLNEALQQANDRAVRWQAELENYRKRARRELDEQRRYAAQPLLRDLLAVVDNLQRAIDAGERTDQAAGLLEGVRMVGTLLAGVLAKHDCLPIDAEGQPFDPHLHEAVGQEPSDLLDAGLVARVLQPGYRLHDRVVRPAQVLVSQGPAAANHSTTTDEGSATDEPPP